MSGREVRGVVRKRVPGNFEPRVFALASLIVAVMWPGGSWGQEQFDYVRRKTQITLSIRQSLPPARLGLQLLGSGGSEEELARASAAIYASYKHLRAAQESSQNLQAQAKFPDPLVTLRNARIQWIRDRLRFCADNEGHLVRRQPEVTETCMKGLVEAVRRLEIVVATEE